MSQPDLIAIYNAFGGTERDSSNVTFINQDSPSPEWRSRSTSPLSRMYGPPPSKRMSQGSEQGLLFEVTPVEEEDDSFTEEVEVAGDTNAAGNAETTNTDSTVAIQVVDGSGDEGGIDSDSHEDDGDSSHDGDDDEATSVDDGMVSAGQEEEKDSATTASSPKRLESPVEILHAVITADEEGNTTATSPMPTAAKQ